MLQTRSTYKDIDEEDIIDFILTYNITDYRTTFIEIYRRLGKDIVGDLLCCIERRFVYEID
jgi:hypothetical protein